jgi:NAD(P)-dependent dehydrogenase (short-subunit alcohol dehydrogenase family)
MKTVLITGASSGIGKATALLFASRGWKIIAGMRNPQVYEGNTFHGNIHTVQLDMGNSDSIQLAATTILKDFGPVDALVNCAGYGMFGVFESIKISDIVKQYEVNVFV